MHINCMQITLKKGMHIGLVNTYIEHTFIHTYAYNVQMVNNQIVYRQIPTCTSKASCPMSFRAMTSYEKPHAQGYLVYSHHAVIVANDNNTNNSNNNNNNNNNNYN